MHECPICKELCDCQAGFALIECDHECDGEDEDDEED